MKTSKFIKIIAIVYSLAVAIAAVVLDLSSLGFFPLSSIREWWFFLLSVALRVWPLFIIIFKRKDFNEKYLEKYFYILLIWPSFLIIAEVMTFVPLFIAIGLAFSIRELSKKRRKENINEDSENSE